MKTEHFIKSKSIKDKSPTYNANYTKLYMNSYAFVNKQNKLPKSFKNEEHIHKAMRKNKSKKLLILDLDETIIHSSYQKTEDNYDLVFYNVTILNKLIFIKNQLEIEGNKETVYVNIRPGLDEFLDKLSKLFEVAIFTSSEKNVL